jgi:hypothetical protein
MPLMQTQQFFSYIFRKLNTGIGFRNRERLFPVLSKIKKIKINPDRPTLDFLDM